MYVQTSFDVLDIQKYVFLQNPERNDALLLQGQPQQKEM